MTKLRFLSFAAAIAILALIIWRLDFRATWRAVQDVDIRVLLLVATLQLLIVALLALRSAFVLNSLGHSVRFWLLVPATLLGFVAGALTPAGSGEVLRVRALYTHAGVPVADCLVLVLYERFASLYLMALTTAAAFSLGAIPAPWGVVVVGGSFALAFVPYVAAVTIHPSKPSNDAVPGGGLLLKGYRYALTLARDLQFLLGDLRLTFCWWTITTLIFALIALQFWLLADTLSPGFRLVDAWVAFGASQLAGIASLLPLGFGVADASLAAILNAQGMSIEGASLVALLVRGTTILSLLGAAVSYFALEWRARQPAAVDSA